MKNNNYSRKTKDTGGIHDNAVSDKQGTTIDKEFFGYSLVTSIPEFFLKQLGEELLAEEILWIKPTSKTLNIVDIKERNKKTKSLLSWQKKIVDTLLETDSTFITVLQRDGRYNDFYLLDKKNILFCVSSTLSHQLNNQHVVETNATEWAEVLRVHQSQQISEHSATSCNSDVLDHIKNSSNYNGNVPSEIWSIACRSNIIEKELKNALKNNEFTVVFQPIINEKKTVIGAEALMRWRNPLLGDVDPDEFIKVAESNGLIFDIGLWVFEKACKYLTKQVTDLAYLSVNVSHSQLKHTDFLSKILDKIASYPQIKNRLRYEITETSAIEDLEYVSHVMNELKRHQIYFMLDDFGTGYSSLAHLHSLPVIAVKIDKAYISNVHNSERSQTIIKAIEDMCSSFSIEIIVEGVEHNEEFKYLDSIGINRYQGYYFSKPLSISEFELLANTTQKASIK